MNMIDTTNSKNFFTNYQFLDFSKEVAKNQIDLTTQPTETWAQIGTTLRKVCWNNTKAIGYVGVDISAYFAATALRSMGFCLPPLPAPPQTILPHDNAEFLLCSIERALWTWKPEDRAVIEEGISCSMSDEYNVFQVVGEFTIAYAFENQNKRGMYTPSFLTASESLENDQSFKTIGKRFGKLNIRDQRNILQAIYEQKEPKLLSASAKQVHSDMRALASKLHQGNEGYLKAFMSYNEAKEAAAPAPAATTRPATAPTRAAAHPIPVYPITPATFAPNPARTAFPPLHTTTQAFTPSAPPLYTVSAEVEMAEKIRFLRESITTVPGAMELIKHITNRSVNSADRMSLVSKLAVVNAFQESSRATIPDLFWGLKSSTSREVFVSAALKFSTLSPTDFYQLRNSLINGTLPTNDRLNNQYWTILEFSRVLEQSPDFAKLFAALQIDLIAAS